LGEETNTIDGENWSEKLRGIRSAILSMFRDTDNKVDLGKAIYLIGNEGSLVAYYHGGDTEDPDQRLAKIIRHSSASSDLDLRPKEE
jgi:hypothetical protein